jgi:hypothetical protein
MGPNGSGSITLASMVARLKTQENGAVDVTARSPQIDQESPERNNDRRRHCSSNVRYIGPVCSIPVLAGATSDILSSVSYLSGAGLNGTVAGRARYGCV